MKGRKVIRMRTQLSLIVTGMSVYLILTVTPVHAHHAFSAEYDANKPVTLRGTVTKLEWINPHAWIYIDSKKADGRVEQWMIETAGPSALMSRGYTRDFLKLGTEVVVNGYQSKSGALRVNARDLTVPGGQPLFVGSTGTGAPYDDAAAALQSLQNAQTDLRTARTQVAGAWWMNNALMERLGITDEQKAKIERTFENHRQAIVSNTDALEKEEAQLARLLDAEPVDQNAVYTQIDRVVQARGEMERINSVMTLEMRQQLTRAQWDQLSRTNLTTGAAGRGGRTVVPVPAPVPGQRRGQ
jgi:Spy/CpxP family protein refolding chaperone